MVDWYWGLSGVTWFVTTFLLGAVPIAICGAFVVLMAKSIAQSTEHDINTCPCRRCEYRRTLAINKRYADKPAAPADQRGQLISTADLQEDMVVIARKNGNPYRVKYIEPRIYGYVVILRNLNSNAQSWMTVPYSTADNKIWKLADDRMRRVYGL